MRYTARLSDAGIAPFVGEPRRGWGHWFNTARLLEPIGYVPPDEHEAGYRAQALIA